MPIYEFIGSIWFYRVTTAIVKPGRMYTYSELKQLKLS